MARILAVSSQVAWGHIGLGAGAFALQRMGHDVCALPTILLSNRPGLPNVAGAPVDPDLLVRMFDALVANGWATAFDAVLTGYMPTPAHVVAAARMVDAVRTARQKADAPLTVLCDPVVGDDPKGIYVDALAAEAVRSDLVCRADIVTPNRFELSWLSGLPVSDPGDARAAAAALPVPLALATSIPSERAGSPDQTDLTNLLLTGGRNNSDAAAAGQTARCDVRRRPRAPHGTGDFLAAAVLGAYLHGVVWPAAVRRGVAALDAILDGVGQSSGVDAGGRLADADDNLHPPLAFADDVLPIVAFQDALDPEEPPRSPTSARCEGSKA